MYEICKATRIDERDGQPITRRCVAAAHRHDGDPDAQHYDWLGPWRADGTYVDPHKL